MHNDLLLGPLKFEEMLPPVTKAQTKRREICEAFQSGSCQKGDQCHDRHVISAQKTAQLDVCKHWLRGTCVNGDNCLFMHEYDERFIPECAFYQRIGECTNPECPFRHVDPLERRPLCAAYLRGFCPKGPNCTLRHVFQEACVYYMTGFCPLGSSCTHGHPVQQLYDRLSVSERLHRQMFGDRRDDPSSRYTCFKCFDPGHLPKNCPGTMYGEMFKRMMQVQEPGEKPPFLPDGRLNGRFCFSCGEEGHDVKHCPTKDLRSAVGARRQTGN